MNLVAWDLGTKYGICVVRDLEPGDTFAGDWRSERGEVRFGKLPIGEGYHAFRAVVREYAPLGDVHAIELPPINRGKSYIPGMFALLAAELVELDRAIATINPSTLKKYATGSGRATKGEMIVRASAIMETHGYREELSEDEADAVLVASWAIDRVILPTHPDGEERDG